MTSSTPLTSTSYSAPSSPVQPFESKDDARLFARRVRDDLSDVERAKAERAVSYRLITLPAFLSASTILTYSAFEGELSTRHAIKARERVMGAHSARIAYPRTTGESTMRAHECTEDDLECGRYGLLEPREDSPKVDLSLIDVVLVPGIAFDKWGNRLGYGKGYYDRLAKCLSHDTVTIGLCYDETLLMRIPAQSHDCCMDYVVTPSALYST
jgi:5-formyltetrahydrofolate cyclo-ligase